MECPEIMRTTILHTWIEMTGFGTDTFVLRLILQLTYCLLLEKLVQYLQKVHGCKLSEVRVKQINYYKELYEKGFGRTLYE